MPLQGHRNPITNVAFSPNTKHLQLATGSTDKTAKIWDLTSEQCSITPEVRAKDKRWQHNAGVCH